jgi:hypothetical protein
MTDGTHETTLSNLHTTPKPPFRSKEPKRLSITAKTAKMHFAKLAGFVAADGL